MPEPHIPSIDIIIPALNECKSIPKVLADVPREWVREVVVVNNGSDDCTAEAALDAGASVIDEPRRGYGQACLTGIRYLAGKEQPPAVVVFLDADYSDHPEELPQVVQPILDQQVDLVIGSRALGVRERGALQPQQVWGNRLATFLLRTIYGYRYTDLGPFRAVKWEALQQIQMADRNYGWTVEMQLKAAKHKLRVTEVPVSYRRRVGTSKISGTLSGTLKAGHKIIYTILRHW